MNVKLNGDKLIVGGLIYTMFNVWATVPNRVRSGS